MNSKPYGGVFHFAGPVHNGGNNPDGSLAASPSGSHHVGNSQPTTHGANSHTSSFTTTEPGLTGSAATPLPAEPTGEASGAGGSSGAGESSGTTSEEDERFFKLAKEAIVATANASKQPHLDPTLNDLFMRLQYVSSPHGNPIRNGENIKVNANGQLMIQDFYNNFPNLNNDIFKNNDRKLVGENPLAQYNSKPEPAGRKYQCTSCYMNFKRSSDLKRHEKQHLTVPPNICELCGKGFARKDALKRHIGTATCKRNAEKRLYVDNLGR